MNKVTSYLKNVGKSVTYATVDASLKLVPEVKDFVETNEDILKASFATVFHFKKSVRETSKLAKQSQIYKDIHTGIDNVLSDIKTGNFYNQERAQAAIDNTAEMMAGGLDDFGEDFNFDEPDKQETPEVEDVPATPS